MKLTRLEKCYVNSRKQTANNIKIAEHLFSKIDLSDVNDVLEIGCGIGTLASYLVRKHSWNVTGIDLDIDQIRIAKHHYKENKCLNFIVADVTKLPFGERKFDVVLSFDVLHHVINWERAVIEIDRVLKPQGFYILNDLSFPRSTVRIFKDLCKKYFSLINVNDVVTQLKGNNSKVVYIGRPRFMGHFNLISRKNLKTIVY